MAKPLVGINCDIRIEGARRPQVFLHTGYVDAVIAAGGVPLLLPSGPDEGDIARLLATVDALLLTGGGDLAPSMYGQSPHPTTHTAPQRRLRFDLSLAKAALAGGAPILGICVGMQLLNVAAGGQLMQDVRSASQDFLQHRRPDAVGSVHEVHIAPGSRLARIVTDAPLAVNSTHHQAVSEPAPGFEVSARAPDGVIEALERPGERMVLAVQWHPERIFEYPRHRKLFEALVQAASH